MRVRCISSSAERLPGSCLNPKVGISADTKFPLTLGMLYMVHAITTFHGQVWYYVFDDNKLSYPVWRLAPLFEVVDPSLPRSWIYGYVRSDATDPGFPLISFPEWATDHRFYERLVDGDAKAVRVLKERSAEAEGHV